ncbi:MAG TPA: PQQ-dependent sugar dehydrogenase [Gemmatimonadaceae bacterium]|nr:PQQ-dependent sugar dehydrogenase [Gemmatimonadaceae bacterium]
MKALVLLLAVACGKSDTPTGAENGTPAPVQLALREVATGLQQPVYLTAPPNDNRLFIVEQPGRIRIVRNGQLLQQPFIDLSSRLSSGGERGLLGLAFHPSYATNGFFYVNYTDNSGDTRVVRYARSVNPDVADPASADTVLTVDQPFGNHNGGHLLFGPDGMLYIPLGDGGSGGDPQNNAQTLSTLLGKLLRIDVNSGSPYAIPPDNPFTGRVGARFEIWAYGLRNPWRTSFDRGSSLYFIADVGQNREEEINAVERTVGGLNYGWRIMEGSSCYNPSPCDEAGLTLPVHTYATSGGNCAVTGGYVYRGSSIPEIAGHYFFTDHCRGGLRSLRVVDGAAQDVREWDVGSTGNVSSFGEDAAGELYIVGYGGTVWRIVKQ